MIEKNEIKKFLSTQLKTKFKNEDIDEKINNLTSIIFDFYNKNNEISIEFAKLIHKNFYDKNDEIIVYRDLEYYHNKPWEYRLHNYKPQIPTSYYSSIKNINKDFINFTNNYTLNKNKTKDSILKYFFDFLRIHPFWDSNLTIASIICDLECIRFWFAPLSILDIRFHDKDYIHYFIYYYEKNINKSNILNEIINLIDNINENTITNEIIIKIKNEVNKLQIKSTKELHNPNSKSDLNKKEALEKALVLAKETYKKWNYPIWAILLVNDEIKIYWENKVTTEKSHSHHAEIDIIKKSNDLKWKNDKKTLIVTMEPCNNCSKALVEFWIDEVFYIVEDPSWWWTDILEEAWIKIVQVRYKYDEYLDILIDFMQNHWWYEEVLNQYLSIKETWENTYKKNLEKVIEKYFINLDKNEEIYEIRKIVYNNTLHYLRYAFYTNKQELHQAILNWYYNDTNKIVNFINENFIEKEFILSTELIKSLHKIFFPEWFIEKSKDEYSKEFIVMIPWQFRKINTLSTTNQNKDIYLKWQAVEKWLIRIIDKFNNSKRDSNDIFIFASEFSRVHPFWNWNGRVLDVLTDILLLKNWNSPLYLWKLKQESKIEFYNNLDKVYETKDSKYLIDFIKKYS